MNVILFGATGMVGQGVLRECLLDDGVRKVLTVGRAATGQLCLGVSSAGMTEAQYHRVTYDLTLAAAETLVRLNPGMTFIYVSGAGTDSTERGRSMWARVKGKTENALLRLPFKSAYMFRPGGIQPLHGIKSKTPLYRILYSAAGPLLPVLKKLFPNQITTTEQVGRAMIKAARHGAGKPVLEAEDINRFLGRPVVKNR